MATTKKNVQDHLKDLQAWIDSLKSAVTNDATFKQISDNAELPLTSPVWGIFAAQAGQPAIAKFLEMSGMKPLARSAGDISDQSTITFEKFLESMSRTMVSAQRQLDDESGRYLSQIAADDKKRHVMPSIFRLPKLNAQMKFALDASTSTSLGLIFYKHDEKTSSRNEQSIDFDIVSVPAPPDAAAAVRAIGPSLDLVLDPFERRRALDLMASATSAPVLAPLIDAAKNTPSQVVLLGLSPSGGEQRYIALFADPSSDADEHAVGAWLLTVAAGGTGTLEVIYRLNRKNGPEEGHLKSIVADVAAQQKAFFG